MMDSSGDFSQTLNGKNKLFVFNRPQLLSVRVPALPIDLNSVVMINGLNYPANLNYSCIFSKKFALLNYQSPAVR